MESIERRPCFDGSPIASSDSNINIHMQSSSIDVVRDVRFAKVCVFVFVCVWSLGTAGDQAQTEL